MISLSEQIHDDMSSVDIQCVFLNEILKEKTPDGREAMRCELLDEYSALYHVAHRREFQEIKDHFVAIIDSVYPDEDE